MRKRLEHLVSSVKSMTYNEILALYFDPHPLILEDDFTKGKKSELGSDTSSVHSTAGLTCFAILFVQVPVSCLVGVATVLNPGWSTIVIRWHT